ncbi:MAG: hypothetical protein HXK22_01550 [Alloprevotella tannerae]|nr:hypothetical protein [Alloprevotella tannerae]
MAAANHRLVAANYRLAAAYHRLAAANDGPMGSPPALAHRSATILTLFFAARPNAGSHSRIGRVRRLALRRRQGAQRGVRA